MTETTPVAHNGVVAIPKLTQLAERLYNYVFTWFPSHHVRQAFLRAFGATIGRDTSIMMGVTLWGLTRLTIGDRCSIGTRCLLDARGEITIDDDVVLASDVHIITAKHVANSPDFRVQMGPVHIKHHAWVGSRATVLQDVTIGVGGVVGACALAISDVADMEMVGGIPAKRIGTRESSLDYQPVYRPILT